MASTPTIGFNAKRGFYAEALPLPDCVNVEVTAGAATPDQTVPAGAQFVRICSTVIFYLKRGGTAAVPAADVSDGSGSQLYAANTEYWFAVTPAEVIGVAVGAAAIITFGYFKGSDGA